eukprot:scaffold48869_cov52-Phaeocystis_antarctica.AAC.3
MARVRATASSEQREAPHRPARAATLAAAMARAGEGQDAEGVRAPSAASSRPSGPTANAWTPELPRTPCPAHLFWRSGWGACCSRGGENPTDRLARTPERVRGAGTGLKSSLGHDRSRIPAMASSQGDVRSSPMAYPAVRPLPKLPLPLRPERALPLSSSTCSART